jgi:DNA-directed RNA polymerase III subunit RPC8
LDYFIVKFRAVVFRPFIGEVLVGKVRRCSPEGVHVSVGFFHDILIPKDSLQYPSKFDKDEQLWVWEYRVDDNIHDMYIDIDEDIRFRIVDDTFVDVIPKSEPPSSAPRTPNPSLHPAQSIKEETETQDSQHLPPYSITGTINESGLGLLSWWTES